jgi:hypothetical protein
MESMKIIEEKMEQKEKKERKDNVIITGIGRIIDIEGGERMLRKGDAAGKNRNLGAAEERYAK